MDSKLRQPARHSSGELGRKAHPPRRALSSTTATTTTTTTTATPSQRQRFPVGRRLGIVVGRCQYCHGKQASAGSVPARTNSLAVILNLSIVLACLLVSPSGASSHLDASQRQPPTIYSYSAGELGQDAILGPLTSHRLSRPYSWNNQRLAKLMADADVDQDEASFSGDGGVSHGGGGDNLLLMGDPGEQSDYSLLYAQRSTKTSPTSPANRWPARGNRRRRPTTGTKRVSGSRPATKTSKKSTQPSTKGQPASPAAAPGLPLDAPTLLAAPTRNATTANRASPTKRKNLVCYYGTWAVYRPDGGKFAVEDIDPFLCTHVIYGFTGLSYDNLIKPLDPWNDLEDNYGKGAMKRFTNLKRINPDLKTLVAIGGWNEGSIKYSKMASDPEARAKFVDSVVQFLAKYNFDGLDLDWEYPGSRGGASYDKQNFVKLLKQLHEAFAPRQYLLTAAVSAGKWFVDPAYDIPQVSKYLDLINLMAYDYHGGWETKTGLNAPLFSSAKYDLTREEQMLNVNWSVNYWLQQGAQREKIMLGVGSYGRSFTLDKGQVNGVNAPASQKGQAGPYTREPGSLGYNELCEAFKRSPQQWTIVRDPDYLAPYAYNRERQWVGYDDQESLALKAQFAKSMGLGGVMMWSIETDDFRGSCHGEKFPLLNTIRRVMDGQGGVSPTSRPPAPPPKPAEPTPNTTRRPAPTGGAPSTVRPPPPPLPPQPTVSSTTRRPDGEVEEDQQRPVTVAPVSSTRRPAQPPSVRPTSTTTTTTRQPAASAEFTCREAGTFADPQNCRKFIRCVQMGAQIQRYSFDCPPGTAFNDPQQYCDHLYNVPQCNGDGSTRRTSNKWPVTSGEVEEVSARVNALHHAGANNYPVPVLHGQPLIPLLAVAGHHFPQFGPYVMHQSQPAQQPLIVQWR